MATKTIFFKGEIHENKEYELDMIISFLKAKLEWLHSMKISELIDLFDAISKLWASDKKIKERFGNSLNFLSNFLKKENLEPLLDTALRNKNALDDFVKLNRQKVLFHAQPRG